MRLPLLGSLDPQRSNSPIWSIQNIQFTKPIGNAWEIYVGVKNLLDWTPNKGNPFLIARADDPFDKRVKFDNEGHAIPTSDDLYGLTFDPTYVLLPTKDGGCLRGYGFQLRNSFVELR